MVLGDLATQKQTFRRNWNRKEQKNLPMKTRLEKPN